MAVSHILKTKSTLPLHRIRFLRPRSRFCSSLDFNGKLSKAAAAEEKRIMAIEPFGKENEGGGGSWFGLRHFARNLKSKFVRTIQPPNHDVENVPTPVVPTVSTVIESRITPDCENQETHEVDQKLTDPQPPESKDANALTIESIPTGVESCSCEENYSDEAIESSDLESTDQRTSSTESCTVKVRENEESKSEESLSDTIFDIAKNRNSPLECLSSNEGKRGGVEYENSSSERIKSSFPVGVARKKYQLKDCHIKPEAEEGFKPRSLKFSHEFIEQSKNKPSGEEISNIKSLIDSMRVLTNVPSSTETTDSGNIFSGPKNSLNVNTKGSDDDDNVDFKGEEMSESDDESIDSPELESGPDISVPRKNEDKNSSEIVGKGSEENKVVLKFLHAAATERDVHQIFSTCGKISKIEIIDFKNPFYKAAYVYFTTRKGLEKALTKNEIFIKRGCATVESASSTAEKIRIPSLMGDSSIPSALVKNPTRTIKIEKLTPEISSHHIEDALAFCESNISGYFLGPCNSVAYVEFETEKAKERALAKHSINVLGKNLIMLRIDAPRTTVVRIKLSDMNSEEVTKSIISICKSMGAFKGCSSRLSDILDVQFGVADWPNMLNIINRLNGFPVKGRRLQAEPAPVFPPEILSALLEQPEGRKHLKTTVQTLLHNMEDSADGISELTSLENDYWNRKE